MESGVCFHSSLSIEVSGTLGVGGLEVCSEGACEQEPPTFSPKALLDPEPLKVHHWFPKTSDPRAGTEWQDCPQRGDTGHQLELDEQEGLCSKFRD